MREPRNVTSDRPLTGYGSTEPGEARPGQGWCSGRAPRQAGQRVCVCVWGPGRKPRLLSHIRGGLPQPATAWLCAPVPTQNPEAALTSRSALIALGGAVHQTGSQYGPCALQKPIRQRLREPRLSHQKLGKREEASARPRCPAHTHSVSGPPWPVHLPLLGEPLHVQKPALSQLLGEPSDWGLSL